jgi:aryl-alcohol dehydrogenase-like predicted oxidoreductase
MGPVMAFGDDETTIFDKIGKSEGGQMLRTLGRSGIEVSAMGLGTARIGGLGFSRNGDRETKMPRSAVSESKRAVRAAVDRGITFIDTADVYGAGRAERLLRDALRGIRRKVVIATKFGELFDEKTGNEIEGADVTPEYVEQACDRSLRRLGTDVIDLYLFHLADYPMEKAEGIRDALEDLVSKGKIRHYGWSTDDPERARLFAEGPHCTAVEHRLNILHDATEMLELCDEEDLASVNRVPLLIGMLTGRWHRGDSLPEDDRRSDWFRDEEFSTLLDRAEAIRPLVTEGGRSYVQGAIGWIWARHPRAIPVPGFRSVEQVEELVGAMRFGPLSKSAFERAKEIMRQPL